MKMHRLLLVIAAVLLVLAPMSLAQTGKRYRVGILMPRCSIKPS